MNLYAVHGVLQALAFGVLFPLGMAVALYRDSIGYNWFRLHVGIQAIAVITMFIAVACVVIEKINRDTTYTYIEKTTPTHVVVGGLVVLLVCIQILWALVIRRFVPYSIWYNGHVILALGIVITGWINIYLGYRHYKTLA